MSSSPFPISRRRLPYVTALGWQGSTMTVQTLNSSQFSIGNLVSAQLLNNTAGSYINLPKPTQDASGLHFSMPSSNPPFSALAYVVKMTFSPQIPALNGGGAGNGRYHIVNRGTGTALDGMGSTTAGSATDMWAVNGNINNEYTITAV